MPRNHKKMILVLMIMLLAPAQVPAAEAVRYKFSRSVYADEAGKGFKLPEGVACGKDRLAVADSGNGRIVLFSFEKGEPRNGKEIRLPEMVYPFRVLFGTEGDLFVLDTRQRKIVHLSGDGAFLNYVDTAQVPADGMLFPAGIALDGADKLYLLDLTGNRVLILGKDGSFQRQIALPAESGFVTDVAANAKGAVFVVDAVKGTLYSNEKDAAVFAPVREKMKEDLKFASNIMLDGNGLLYITDQNGGGIVVMEKDGTLRRLFAWGWKEGTLRYPAQVCATGDGALFVADRSNNRIEMFTPLK